MNKDRREAITKIMDQFLELKEMIEALKDEEQEYFDNMPENMQGGDKGQAAEAAISQLEEAESSCESIIDNLEEAKS